jgi:DNA (cytosine-5)-methyltransferase 1
VLVETICIFVKTKEKPGNTIVESLTKKISYLQNQKYIMDQAFPYWVIYRDEFFDKISQRLEFDKFTVFRDRQVTNSNTKQKKEDGTIRVLKSRNISDNGKEIVDIPGYDSYIDKSTAEKLSAYKFVGNDTVYLTPNMTYKPRLMNNKMKALVNGSVAVLIPKEELVLSEEQMEYFSSEEYRKFYQIARNYQTRSLNVDATSVFFYGVLKERANG